MAYRKSYSSMVSLMILNGPRFRTKIPATSGVILRPHSACASWPVRCPQGDMPLSDQSMH